MIGNFAHASAPVIEPSYDDVQHLVGAIFEGALVAKQQEVLAHTVIGAIFADAQHVATIGRIGAVGRAAARARDVSESRSHMLVDRLLSDRKLNLQLVQEKLTAYFAKGISELQVSLEWLSFDPDGHRTAVLLLIDERYPALPLVWQSVSTKGNGFSPREVEQSLLRALFGALPEHVQKLTVFSDMPVEELPVFEEPSLPLNLQFVASVPSGTVLESAAGEAKCAREFAPVNGHARRLEGVRVPGSQTPVAVVCIKRAKDRDACCLVTNRLGDASQIVSLYTARLAAVEKFRKQMSERLGFGMYACTMSSLARRDRLLFGLVMTSVAKSVRLLETEHDTAPSSRIRNLRPELDIAQGGISAEPIRKVCA